MLKRDMEFRLRDTSHTTLNAFLMPDSKTYFRTTGVSLFHIFQNSPEGAATQPKAAIIQKAT